MKFILNLNLYKVFVDAPLVLQPADLAIFDSKAINAEETTPQSKNPEDIPLGWWKADPDRTKAVGLEESLLNLKEVLMKDTYDVCGLPYRVSTGA